MHSAVAEAVELDPVTLRAMRSYSVKDIDLVFAAGNQLFATDPVSGVVRAHDLRTLRPGR